MRGSKRRMVRAQRRLEHARRRPTAREAALFERMRVAYLKWVDHRGDQLRDVCPACSATVVVTPRDGESDVAHATPICDAWLAFATAIGGHSPRFVNG